MSLSAPLGASASPGASVEPSDRDAARALLEDILKIRTAKGYGQTPAQAELLAERLRAAGFTDDQIDAYMELKWEEVYAYEHTPHPVEYKLYYSC